MTARATLRLLAVAALAPLALAACADDASSAATDSASASGANATAAPGDAGSDSAWIARPASLGRIRTGMPRAALVALLGQPSRAGYDAQERCTYVRGTALPSGVQVMVFDSTVARIDVTEPGVSTADSVQVGDSEEAVLARYGTQAVVTPHKYSGPVWHHVTVTPPGDSLHRIVFETDGRVVKSYRVGRLPEVEWIEGCA